MTTINKITDGVGTSYDLAVRADNIQPIAEKSWTGLIASANASAGNGSDFILGEFNIVTGTNWVLEVEIDADYTATDWSSNIATSHHICHAEGYGNATISYSMWNNIRSTTYRPFYYFVIYRPSTVTNKFYFGICLYNCNKNTDANNKRNITCRVRLAKNLTNVALHDAPANTDYTTYYVSSSRSAYNCYDNGLRETGDDNSTANLPSYDHVAWCTTGAGTAAKSASFSYFDYAGGKVFKLYMNEANTASTPTLNVNGQGSKAIYLLTGDNVWSVADGTNKTITKGIHWVYWSGTAFYILPDAVNSTAYTNDVAFLQGQASYATKNVFCNGEYGFRGGLFKIRIHTANTNAGDLSLNVNNYGAKPLYRNGKRANGTTNNITSGWFGVTYDGTNYQLYDAGTDVVYQESKRAQKLHSLTIDVSDGNTHYYKFLTKGAGDRAKNSVIAFGMRDSGDVNPAGFLYLRTTGYTSTAGKHLIKLARYTSDTTYYPHMRAVTDSSSGITSVYIGIGGWGGAWFSYVNGHDNLTFMKEEITAAEWNALGSNIDISLEASTSDITTAINALDVTDTAVATQLVSAVSETDGKISVSRRALVAADIPNLDASKITTGNLNYWRQEVYSLDYHRTSASGSEYDGKQWTKFAWKEIPNYATASVWDSCDGVFDVFRKSYAANGITHIGELSLTSSWGHGTGTGYSLKTSGNKSAVWNSYINTTMCAKEEGAYNSGKVTVKVVCSDTTIEWWICNQLWDASIYLKPKFKSGFTGITSNATSGAVLKTVEEFTEYCSDKTVVLCQLGNTGMTPTVFRANHMSLTSDYPTYKELDFSSTSITWADFIAGRDNTNSFCYKLFQNASFDTTSYTIRAIGRLSVNSEIMLELDVASNYPQYEIYAVRQVGYVKFSGAGRVRIFNFNRYGVIGSKFRFMGDVTGNLTGNVTGNVTGNLTGNAATATSASSVPEFTTAEVDSIWQAN